MFASFFYFACLKFETKFVISLLPVTAHTIYVHTYNGNIKIISCLSLLNDHLASKDW